MMPSNQMGSYIRYYFQQLFCLSFTTCKTVIAAIVPRGMATQSAANFIQLARRRCARAAQTQESPAPAANGENTPTLGVSAFKRRRSFSDSNWKFGIMDQVNVTQ